jgi:GAF domain-containing protein
VISTSQTTVQPVLDAVVASAARLCEAVDAAIFLRDADTVTLHASVGPLGAHHIGERLPINRDWVTGRAVLEARTVQVKDLANNDEYPEGREMARSFGHRAILAVPLLREGIAVGAINTRRREARPFTDKQVALVESFAAQVVIALENARLLTELRARTDELARSVGELRALGEVSQAVNSTLNVEEVLTTIVTKAVQLSGTEAGAIYTFDEVCEEFQLRATYGMSQEMIKAIANQHITLQDSPRDRWIGHEYL